MGICIICGKEIKNLKRHLNFCIKAEEKYKSIDIELVKKMYSDEKSAYEIADYFGIKRSQIYRLFERWGIKNRSLKEVNNLKSVKSKRILTNIERYGSSHNFNRDHESRKRWEKKMIETEGICNVGQRNEVKEKIKKSIKQNWGVNHFMELKEIKEKISRTNLLKYGVDHPMKDQEFKETFFDNFLKKYGTYIPTKGNFSTIHKKVCDFLRENLIDFEIEFKIKTPERIYFYDIKIAGKNKIIEVNGDYWHANPIKYKPHDVLERTYLKEAYLIWESDYMKEKCAISKGNQYLVVWENDIKTDWNELKEKILIYAKD